MSIATLAPEKFDFQDLVCIEMMLRFYDRIKFEFRIEPDDGEDAEMMFIRNTDQLTRFEIQVKGAKGTVSLNTVAECLAHFPNRKATDSLFERLMDDPDRLVVLVMSGRCDDESSIYIPSLEWQGDSHSLSNFRKKDAEALLKSLINVINSGGDKSKLQAKRRTHLEKIAKQAILNDVQSILSRLIVIEQVSDDTLMEKCESLLRKHHRIPIDRTAEVIAQLRSIVKTAKIRKQNAFVDFSSELAKFKPPRIRPVGYIAHGKEDEWINTLSRSSALLISGLPRVGKTHVACWIAAEFEEMGYKVEKAFDIDTAERFLLDSVDAQRLAILDDPLGGAHPVADPLRVFLRIKQLVLQLKPDRKLIVAQAQDRLLNVTRKVKLFDLNIAKIPLIEIEAASSEFSCKLWQQLGEQYSISKALFTIVLNALQSGELSLEAGCLHYLAIENQKVQDPSNLAKVEHLAHVDASSLGQALSHEVGKDILIGLAAATSPGLPITESELAFILGHGGNKLLGISRIVGSQISFPKNSGFHHSKEAPNYELLPQLTNDNQDALEKLELRRIVEWCDQERVSFTHPFYQAAAESLFEENTHKTAHLIRTLLERGIFCLSPITSRATARNIEWIHDRLTNEKNKQALVRLAIDALDSSYPSTRDICFGFLIRQLPNLPNNLRDKLPEWVNKVTFISLSHVEWISGEARLPMGENLIVEDNLWGTIEKSEIVGILSKLDGTSATKVTPECACKAINFYENNSGAMTVCAISRLLSYDEALIRAQAINIWLEQIRQDDADVLQRIFMEDHPAVSKAALEGVIKSWNNYDDKRKSDILEGLQKFPASPASASGMINTLLVFGREEYTGAETPWQIFEAVLPDVLNALPETISINDARLFDVIDKASLNLSVESMLRIIDSWVGILERIVTKRILSDFELGVTQILVNVTKNSKEQRLMRMNRLLSLPGTAALVRIIADLVDNWQDLTDEEQSSIIAILHENRTDKFWLRGAVLTREQVPSILEREILPAGVALSDGALRLMQNLDPHLISTAVRVYIGNPQPLWFIGIHHCGQDIWKNIVEKIAEDPTHALFDKAWEEITSKGDGKLVAHIVETIGTSYSEKVFEQLLRHKLRANGEFMPEAWAALLALAPDPKVRSSWIECMASHANKVLDNLSEARLWLSGENLEEFLEYFAYDTNLLKLVTTIDREQILNSPEIKDSLLSLMQILFEKYPPSHYGTCDSTMTLMQQIGYSSSELSMIQECRESIMTMQLNSELAEPVEPQEIDCWIF